MGGKRATVGAREKAGEMILLMVVNLLIFNRVITLSSSKKHLKDNKTKILSSTLLANSIYLNNGNFSGRN